MGDASTYSRRHSIYSRRRIICYGIIHHIEKWCKAVVTGSKLSANDIKKIIINLASDLSSDKKQYEYIFEALAEQSKLAVQYPRKASYTDDQFIQLMYESSLIVLKRNADVAIQDKQKEMAATLNLNASSSSSAIPAVSSSSSASLTSNPTVSIAVKPKNNQINDKEAWLQKITQQAEIDKVKGKLRET